MASTRVLLVTAVTTIGGLLAGVSPAQAQLDPLLFLKTLPPNVLFVVDTSNRMQRGTPTDASTQTTSRSTSDYYDPFLYSKDMSGPAWQLGIGVTDLNTSKVYRRVYRYLEYVSNASGDKFTSTTIQTAGDKAGSAYDLLEAPTRMSIARAALSQALKENQTVARFGLVKMRQSSPALATKSNSGPVSVSDLLEQVTETGATNGRWKISRPTVSGTNGTASSTGVVMVKPDTGTPTDVLTILGKDTRTAGGLLPAGGDDLNTFDTPVKLMLDDARAEAARLIALATDPTCRNTVVVLVVGGGEGTTTTGVNNASLGTTAATFVNISGRRVPIYVIAIAPPASDIDSLRSIATSSGGQYFEITKTMIDAALAAGVTGTPAGTVVVPEFVNAVNVAIQHAFARSTEFNTAPTSTLPFGPYSEYQVTSPIVGTVNLDGAQDIRGNALPNTRISDTAGTLIPQRSNVLVTSAFTLPGFDARLRAFRMYRPCKISNADVECPSVAAEVKKTSAPSGYKFISDGTSLWVACAPGTVTTVPGTAISSPCGSLTTSQRNLFTVLADGTVVPFTNANAATLAPYLAGKATAPAGFDATAIINYVRNRPIGAIVSSTPAIMDPPSLDPPPDPDYPTFASNNQNRRSIVWIMANDGMLHAIDGRLGIEVWGFIPFNLLPKLRTLYDGQPVGSFTYTADGAPKISDVKVGGSWKTYLVVGESAGGTFYQTFDVTLAGMASTVLPTDSSILTTLTYFSDSAHVPFKWSFPRYSSFDHTISNTWMPYGDLKASATAVEKTVGQTWSDPAVGQVVSSSGNYTMITGSGFFPYSAQTQANRGSVVAGTTLYLIDMGTGNVLDSRNVGSDAQAETVDDCAAISNCQLLKNALHADPVATGPSDSRFVTKAYIGDLDGRVWRFTLGLDASNVAIFTAGPVLLYDASGTDGKGNSRKKVGSSQPIFSSMAAVTVGGSQQYLFFGTGSDLLPSVGINQPYYLIGFLDDGATGSKTFEFALTPVANSTAPEEKVSAFPAVAGDIVFFSTTLFRPNTACALPDAILYALTYIGGPAYDNTGDDAVTSKDTPKVKTIAGERATAPFVADQHLVFGVGNNVSVFGDPLDYNNGVGQAGVRILSWREVR